MSGGDQENGLMWWPVAQQGSGINLALGNYDVSLIGRFGNRDRDGTCTLGTERTLNRGWSDPAHPGQQIKLVQNNPAKITTDHRRRARQLLCTVLLLPSLGLLNSGALGLSVARTLAVPADPLAV